IAGVWILADMSLSTNYAVYLAFEKSHYETALTLVYNTLNIPATMFVLSKGWGLIGVFAAMSAVNAFTMVCGWIISTTKFVKPVFKWDPKLVKEMLQLCLTIGFTRSTRIFYNRIDTWMLQIFVPGGATAQYIAIGIYNTGANLVRKAVTFQAPLSR